MFRGFLQFIAIMGASFLAVLFISIAAQVARTPTISYERPETAATSTLDSTSAATSTTATSTKKTTNTALKKAVKSAPKSQPAAAAESQNTASNNEVHRVEHPYSTPPKSTGEVDALARNALVNIYCQTSGGPLGSISGSGVIIDPKGVILTNAHVAQYILLTSSKQIALDCYIRTGSPAQIKWRATILYMPAAWVYEHAQDIVKQKPKGTGESDYALLLITGSVDGSPLPPSFPYLPSDSREAIAFTSDSVLLAGYPAEFASGATRSALYPTSVFTRIGDLMTFDEKSVDLLSLGSVALAQSGSSGGAVVNLWGQLVGLITTTSEGSTTADRELRAITLAYINRDLTRKTGRDLPGMLSGDVTARAANFMQDEAPALAKQIIGYLPN